MYLSDDDCAALPLEAEMEQLKREAIRQDIHYIYIYIYMYV